MPQTRCWSSSRVSTRPCSRASASSSRNSVGVSAGVDVLVVVAGAQERAPLVGVDPEPVHLDDRAAVVGDAAAAAERRLDAGDELAHPERLRQVVVGADPERVHLVVLGPAGGHGDDRRADPLPARRLGYRPAIEAGQHHVDHGHIGPLIAELGQAALAILDPLHLEAGMAQMLEHHTRNDGVVLDHEHASHASTVPARW